MFIYLGQARDKVRQKTRLIPGQEWDRQVRNREGQQQKTSPKKVLESLALSLKQSGSECVQGWALNNVADAGQWNVGVLDW